MEALMANKIQGVYRIRNITSGKFYIGSSNGIYKRWEVHKRQLRAGNHHNPVLQASWNKHGEDFFKFEILTTCASQEEMLACEQKLIDTHYDDPLCCNASRWAETTPMRGRFGELHPSYGKTMSEEQKQRLREAALEQWAASDPRTGRTHHETTKEKISEKVQAALAEGRGGKFIPDEETRRKMSDSLKGNQNAKGYKRTEAEREAIRQRTLGNQHWLGKSHSKESIEKMGTASFAENPKGEVTRYPSMNAMREALGMAGLSGLIRAIRSGQPLVSGTHAGWRFYTEDEDNRLPIPEEYKDMPRSRSEAQATGAKYYFNTIPCKNGHIAPRKTKGVCTACP
jgi:group I intron endonuclease